MACADNRILDIHIDPIAKRVLALIPPPNANEVGANYIQNFSNPIDARLYHIRGDHAFTAQDQLTLRRSSTESVSENHTFNFNGDATAIRTKGRLIG